MAIDILMPALSPTMESGNLVRWLKQPGDRVAAGDLLAEIETDKATMEIEAVDEGVLAELLVPEGSEDVAVGSVIARLRSGDEKPVASVGTTLPPAAPVATSAAKSRPDDSLPRIRASPLAKRTAEAAGLDLTGVASSGASGRIVRRDVVTALAARSGVVPIRALPGDSPLQRSEDEQPPSIASAKPEMVLPEGAARVPHDRMRLAIARRLSEAKATVPHFYLEAECALDGLLALRTELNAVAPCVDGKPSFRMSVNDLVVRAYALALAAVPEANVAWTDEAMIRFGTVDVAVAVAIPGGLITPVVRAADQLSLSALSRCIVDLAMRARTRTLRQDELEGGAGTVSNLGMYGVARFTAIINPPQASILAVGAARDALAMVEGAVVAHKQLPVTLSVDHRALDGAVAAQLLEAFRDLIEHPLRLVA